jgi:hypothetical protein
LRQHAPDVSQDGQSPNPESKTPMGARMMSLSSIVVAMSCHFFTAKVSHFSDIFCNFAG